MEKVSVRREVLGSNGGRGAVNGRAPKIASLEPGALTTVTAWDPSPFLLCRQCGPSLETQNEALGRGFLTPFFPDCRWGAAGQLPPTFHPTVKVRQQRSLSP